jgi:putative spermidine/putrescine transport system ATP-binding protein
VSEATTTAPGLAVDALAAPFGGVPGLGPLSFALAPGERLAVVGPSGAGKTTLLRAIAGLSPSSGGRVAIGGRDVSTLPAERRDAVYVHQTPLLFPHLDVAGNVAFPLRVRGVRGAEAAVRVRAALAAVRLEALASRATRTLSGGQRHRVALARAIVARPAALLLDEPLAALDPTLRDEVRDAILAVQRAYRPALVVVTHDLDEAGILGDRVGVLLDGALAQLDPPAALFARPASLAVARFLGAHNLIEGTVDRAGTFHSPLGPVALREASSVGAATLAVRPDAIRVERSESGAGRVVELRHRPARTTARIALGEIVAEATLVPGGPIAAGDAVAIRVDPREVVVYPRASVGST